MGTALNPAVVLGGRLPLAILSPIANLALQLRPGLR